MDHRMLARGKDAEKIRGGRFGKNDFLPTPKPPAGRQSGPEAERLFQISDSPPLPASGPSNFAELRLGGGTGRPRSPGSFCDKRRDSLFRHKHRGSGPGGIGNKAGSRFFCCRKGGTSVLAYGGSASPRGRMCMVRNIWHLFLW